MTSADKTGATRQAALKERRRAAGWKRVEVWVPPSGVPAIRELEKWLQSGEPFDLKLRSEIRK